MKADSIHHAGHITPLTQLDHLIRGTANRLTAVERGTHEAAHRSLGAAKLAAASNRQAFKKRGARVVSRAARQQIPQHRRTKDIFDSRTGGSDSHLA